MKYLCLGYLDIKTFDSIPEAERSEIMRECYAQCVSFRATGKVIEEEGLQSVELAKSIRPRDGKPHVTDGPFIETKEQLGSFFIVEAESIEEAVEVASLHPAARMGEQFGFGIEVRPIQQ
ncbi:MAG TPA: YciI family protein [Fimbriimonas sp.]|nr:YciI family protein [Fimbriimonas sp.]